MGYKNWENIRERVCVFLEKIDFKGSAIFLYGNDMGIACIKVDQNLII